MFLLVASSSVHLGQNLQTVTQPSKTTCSAFLPDGRSLVTGGNSKTGSLTIARFFERQGQLTEIAPMLAGRANHVCIALSDGTVLVAGGVDGIEATETAEIYHPDTNSWTPTLPLLTARRGASSVLLKNGRALIIGGESGGRVIDTLEFYDPVAGRFEQAPGALSTTRTHYAVTALNDGRVLVAGGLQNGKAVDTIDIYDPELGVRFSGRMLVARANFTATTLTDGKVLLVGGTDGSQELTSAEVYDPETQDVVTVAPLATARQNHIAIRSRASGSVVIAGGMADGRDIQSAEIFSPRLNAFEAAQEATSSESGPTITIGALNADATIRSKKTFRVPQQPQPVSPEENASNP